MEASLFLAMRSVPLRSFQVNKGLDGTSRTTAKREPIVEQPYTCPCLPSPERLKESAACLLLCKVPVSGESRRT